MYYFKIFEKQLYRFRIGDYVKVKTIEEDKIYQIYKKVFNIKFSDLTITSFSKNELLTACYNYLKTLDEFKETKNI